MFFIAIKNINDFNLFQRVTHLLSSQLCNLWLRHSTCTSLQSHGTFSTSHAWQRPPGTRSSLWKSRIWSVVPWSLDQANYFTIPSRYALRNDDSSCDWNSVKKNSYATQTFREINFGKTSLKTTVFSRLTNSEFWNESSSIKIAILEPRISNVDFT